MTLPYTAQEVIFNAASASATTVLKSEFVYCLTKVIEIITSGFTGTIDIQGKVWGGADYSNVAYSLMGQDGSQAISNDQIVPSASATARYLVSEPYPMMQIVMTRSAGSVSVIVHGWGVAFSPTADGDVDVMSIAAGTNVIGKVGVDQTTPGTTNKVEASTNVRRNTGVLHRNAITAVDKLTMGALTVTDSNVVIGALAAVAHSVAVVANTAEGPTTPSTGSLTPTVNEAIRIAFAQVANALSYDIFCSATSVDTGKWVLRVTETQRAAGGQCTVVGTYAAGGVAGAIDVAVVGTGVLQSANPNIVNNAYTPAVVAAIGSINCAGYSKARVKVSLSVTDLRSLPTLALIPFFGNQVSATAWHAGARINVPILTALGEGLNQEFEIDVSGEPELVILVDTITGQGSAVSIWVELC